LADPVIEQLASIVIRGIRAGHVVEIDALGTFHPDAISGLRFEAPPPRVFLAHGQEDRPAVLRLYDTLEEAGFAPWIDVRKLLPGQNWPRAIENAIETSDFFVACFSRRSVDKRGGFQAEIRYALECARQVPLDRIFVVPVRLDECRVPRPIQREFQYVDLFPEWDVGVARLLSVLREGVGAQSGWKRR
jgi:hypothetical protein